jgi:hypothetical protein
MRRILYITLATLLVVASISTGAHLQAQQQSRPQQQMPDCPMMKKTGMEGMNERGDKGMGFSQEKTTHHFYLTKTGGIIQVEANDPKDTVSREQIRQHLKHIAMMFAEGNFDIPMFVHDQVPPGVPVMKQLKAEIKYEYEETERGARVRISTSNKEAISAINEFLTFQIKEHQTGDTLEVSGRS